MVRLKDSVDKVCKHKVRCPNKLWFHKKRFCGSCFFVHKVFEPIIWTHIPWLIKLDNFLYNLFIYYSVRVFGWTEMRWLFRCEIVLNLLKQCLQIYGLVCSWTVRTCLTSPSLKAKSFAQWGHLKGLDFSWTLRNFQNELD